MIPRRFFWLFDFLTISAAFLAAYSFFPGIQHLLAMTLLKWIPGTETIAAPGGWSGQLPPLLDLLWIFLTITPTSLIALGVMGNHQPLLYQSRARILTGGFLAPLFGLCLVTLALYALKSLGWSRLFIFSFTLLTMISLGFYRLVLRRYYMVQQRTGHYAKNILLIGQSASIEWMARYFAENVYVQDYPPPLRTRTIPHRAGEWARDNPRYLR
ncbi:MAG: hypothetical protein ABIF87_01335 [Pseudomonadota bacterium]